MAIGERFTSGGAQGIARFLAEHQACNAGYDVRRDEQFGSGKLSITCDGCGASVEYRAAEAGELAAGGHQPPPPPLNDAPAYAEPPPPVAPSAPPPVAPPLPTGGPPPAALPPHADVAPTSAPPSAARPTGMPSLPGVRRKSEPGRRSGVVPSWVSVVLIGALILGGLTMIAIGLTKDDEEPPPAPQAGQTPAQQKPNRNRNQQQPAAGPKQNKQGKNKQGKQRAQRPGAQSQAPAAPAAPIAPATGETGTAALRPRTFAKTFAVGVPAGWDTGRKEGAIALTAPGSTAQILVFFQKGETPLRELARGARGFLAERHKGAQIGAAKPVRVGSQRGLRVVATYQGGEEAAVVLSAKGYSYVILRRVDRGASPDLAQQADAALASFRPK